MLNSMARPEGCIAAAMRNCGIDTQLPRFTIGNQRSSSHSHELQPGVHWGKLSEEPPLWSGLYAKSSSGQANTMLLPGHEAAAALVPLSLSPNMEVQFPVDSQMAQSDRSAHASHAVMFAQGVRHSAPFTTPAQSHNAHPSSRCYRRSGSRTFPTRSRSRCTGSRTPIEGRDIGGGGNGLCRCRVHCT